MSSTAENEMIRKENEIVKLALDVISHEELKELIYNFWKGSRDDGLSHIGNEHEGTDITGRAVLTKANLLRNLILTQV